MENPVTCKVTNVSVKHGKSICSWSSCQEGCTRERFQCYQVRVQYVDVNYKKGTTVDEFSESAWIKLSHFENFENVVITFCLALRLDSSINEACLQASILLNKTKLANELCFTN